MKFTQFIFCNVALLIVDVTCVGNGMAFIWVGGNRREHVPSTQHFVVGGQGIIWPLFAYGNL